MLRFTPGFSGREGSVFLKLQLSKLTIVVAEVIGAVMNVRFSIRFWTDWVMSCTFSIQIRVGEAPINTTPAQNS